MIPIRTDSPLRSTPWMNWVLIAVNVGVFVAELAKPSLRSAYLRLQPFTFCYGALLYLKRRLRSSQFVRQRRSWLQ